VDGYRLQGLDLDDDNVIGQMYDKALAIEQEALDAKKKKAEAVQAKLREEQAQKKAEDEAEDKRSSLPTPSRSPASKLGRSRPWRATKILDLLKAIAPVAFDAVKEPRTPTTCSGSSSAGTAASFDPLPEVEAMPLEEVLMHFFECRYEGMEDEELDGGRSAWPRPAPSGCPRGEGEAGRGGRRRLFQAASRPSPTPTGQARRPAARRPWTTPTSTGPCSCRSWARSCPRPSRTSWPKMDPKLKSVPPEIKMEFVTEAELGDLDDWDVLGPPKPRISDG
jgi:hypothetical protein